MIPLAHVIARRRLDEKRKKNIEDLSPHKVHPYVGLRRRATGAPLATNQSEVGAHLPPTAVYVDINVNRHETMYKIMVAFEAKELSRCNHLEHSKAAGAASSPGRAGGDPESRPHLVQDAFDFYFPVSECGKLNGISVLFNKKDLRGEMVRQSRKDGRFIPSSSRTEFLADDSGDDNVHGDTSSSPTTAAASSAALPRKKSAAKKIRDPQLFYYRVPFVFQQLVEMQEQQESTESNCRSAKKSTASAVSGQVPTKLDIYIEVRVKTIEIVPSIKYRVLFPLLCLPLQPSSLRCEMAMPHLVRRVWTASQRHRVHPFLNNCNAEFSLIFSPEHPLHLEEYLFDIEIELGEPIVPECIDSVSLFVLATAVVMMLFYMLTKDIRDDF